MNRRRAIATIVAATVAAGTARARAAGRERRVVLFTGARPEEDAETRRRILPLFAEFGFVEGRNLSLDFSDGLAPPGQIESVVRAIVASRPDVIGTRGTELTRLVLRFTGDIPIVFWQVADPVRAGLVKSLSQPGANVTGTSNRNFELVGKRVQLLKEIKPPLRRVGALLHDDELAGWIRDEVAAAATRAGLESKPVLLARAATSDDAVQVLRRERPEGLLSFAYPGIVGPALIGYLAEARVPAIFQDAAAVRQGALLSLGVPDADLHRRAVEMMARVLRGERPARMPVDQLSRVTVALNLATARAMGLEVPASIRQRADEVFE